jgi:Fe-S-cluster-containing dehydrogenase component
LEISRRDFTKFLGVGIASGVAASMIPEAVTLADSGESYSAVTPNENSKGMLFDATKCIGCLMCEAACNNVNGLPEGVAYTDVYTPESATGVFAKHQCLHCNEPACVEACIVGALTKTPEGPVVYDSYVCIGCRYCMVACPFGVPQYDWDKTIPYIRKCTFCATRQAEGLEPGCVGICPTGALEFGERNELIATAQRRIQENPDKYVQHIYGEHEAGGTSWLYLSSVPFEQIDMPEMGSQPVVTNTRRIMSGVLPALVLMASTMTGVYFLTGKKRKGEDGKGAAK